MVVCSVLGCKNRTKSAADNVSFHRFPKRDPELRYWILACGRDNWTPPRSASICSAHFEEHFFVRAATKKWLKPDSLPTMYIHVMVNLKDVAFADKRCYYVPSWEYEISNVYANYLPKCSLQNCSKF